ncbi:MAG: hypothetical protein IIB11_05220 [Chloroflexi bacterium]|nr:hypothetical protein [Chloroflexota bacterium]
MPAFGLADSYVIPTHIRRQHRRCLHTFHGSFSACPALGLFALPPSLLSLS